MDGSFDLLYVDLFCGAGGTSTGVESAEIDGAQCAKVVACVNHDANAISSHAANHPEALHFTEDIRTLELSPLVAHLKCCRERYPEAKVVLWASLECTNFSKAKGGLPRDADSRTLAEHLFRYIEALAPDYIQIENVEEFMGWGDMDENGHPLSSDKGRSYLRWVRNVRKYGYVFDWRILNSADYGAYTCRRRFFGIFAKPGLPVVFPRQTHADIRILNEEKKSLFPQVADVRPWRSVREVLDMEDRGESIFNRKKPLCENTLKRIYSGLKKFVSVGQDAFLLKYNSMSAKGVYHAPSLDDPCPVVATQGRLGLSTVSFAESGTYHSLFPSDSPMMRNIKEFMSKHAVADVRMRMLKVSELKRIMGFPDDYVLVGPQSDQKKFIGNAVEVHTAMAWCLALCNELRARRKHRVA